MSRGSALVALSWALLALVAWLRARNLRRQSGLAPGQVVYSGIATGKRLARPLLSARRQLVGRPDYLGEESGHVIPAEVKSTPRPRASSCSHRRRLANLLSVS